MTIMRGWLSGQAQNGDNSDGYEQLDLTALMDSFGEGEDEEQSGEEPPLPDVRASRKSVRIAEHLPAARSSGKSARLELPPPSAWAQLRSPPRSPPTSPPRSPRSSTLSPPRSPPLSPPGSPRSPSSSRPMRHSRSSNLACIARQSVASVVSWSTWAPPPDERRASVSGGVISAHRASQSSSAQRRSVQHALGSDATYSSEEASPGKAGRVSQRRLQGSIAVIQGRPSCQKHCSDIYGRMVIDWRSSSWWHNWEVFVYVATIAMSFLAPYEVAFVNGKPWPFLLADHIVYLFFLVDMVFHFFVALPDPDRPSCLMRQPEVVIPSYIQGWLAIDLMSVLPYAVLFLPGVPAHTIWRVGLCRIARLPRLLLRRTIMRRWQIYFGFSFAALEVVKYLLIVFMACHWMACLWGGIGLAVSDEDQDTWLQAMAKQKGRELSSAAQVYSVCLYWAIMTLTTVGYGDVNPMSMKEYWVACLCMAFSAALWAFIIGEVCRIAASTDPHDTRFMQTMDDLNYLMRTRHMPRSMCKQMRTYLYEGREVARQRAQIPIIEQMSPMLQGQMAMQLHKAWLEKVWYLREIEGQALVNIARRLQSDFFAPNEEVPCHRTLFILRRGICIRRSRILLKGDVWGEDMVVNNQVLRDESPVKAISYLEVIMLHYLDLVQAVKAFPEVSAQIQKVKVKLAVMRGVILVAKALQDLAFREEIEISEITEEVEHYVIHSVLAGNTAMGPRFGSRIRLQSTRTQRSSVEGPPNSDRMRPSESIPSIARRHAIEDDDLEKPVVRADLEALMLGIQQLSRQADNLATGRRSSLAGGRY